MIALRTGSSGLGKIPGYCAQTVRHGHLHEFTNAPHRDVEKRSFRVIHPYHPLFEEEFELLACRQNWGEDRVWFQDRSGRLHSVPTSWTDAAAIDAFVIVAAGRSLFRVTDLLELVPLIQNLESEKADGAVK